MIDKNKTNKIKMGFSDAAFDTILVVLIGIFLLLVLYPLIYIISSSFSSGEAVTTGRVLLWPVDFSLRGYKIVFSYSAVWLGYLNTIFYTVVGTIINVIMVVLAAYPMSRKSFQGRKVLSYFYIIPMFIGGGLIPSYILVSNLHLINTRTVLLVIGALNLTNMVIMRTFFQTSIPMELLESAKMDGISDIGYLIRIVLPLSKAVISVITLYSIVGHWNSFFLPMIYIRDRELYPLQLILREILNASNIDQSSISDPEILSQLIGQADVMKYALVVVAAVPMLIIYPFVQKFFEKGVMIGSLKG